MNIKPYTLEAIHRYVKYGVLPGRFLQAVLRHDLFDAFQYADPDNKESLEEIVHYIQHRTPPRCHGSREAIAAWIHAMRMEKPCATE